jgi:curved DNA-binding protein CbpA
VTIIRYAYRFLAAMYHPDNGETGNAEKFRVITEAWKTLSDDGKRQAYDLSLNMKEQAKGQAAHKPQPKINEFGKDALPHIPKTGLTWNEIELRVAILQIMLVARKKKPRDGGVSMSMIMEILGVTVVETEFAMWYLREKGFIETGERVFMITGLGLDYLVDQLGKTQVLDGATELEKKTSTIVNAGLPARLPSS